MSKTFTYIKVRNIEYLPETDEYEEYGDEFEYEVNDADLFEELINIIYSKHFTNTKLTSRPDYKLAVKSGIRKFINYNAGVFDMLVEEYEDILKDHFEDEALNSFN